MGVGHVWSLETGSQLGSWSDSADGLLGFMPDGTLLDGTLRRRGLDDGLAVRGRGIHSDPLFLPATFHGFMAALAPGKDLAAGFWFAQLGLRDTRTLVDLGTSGDLPR